MAKSNESSKILVTVSKADKEILEKLAKEDDRSVSNYVNRIIRNHLKEIKQK